MILLLKYSLFIIRFQYSSCTTDGDFSNGKPWCSVTSDLHINKLWGYCSNDGSPSDTTNAADEVLIPNNPGLPVNPVGSGGHGTVINYYNFNTNNGGHGDNPIIPSGVLPFIDEPMKPLQPGEQSMS